MADSDMFMNILEHKQLWFSLMWNNMAHSSYDIIKRYLESCS